MRSKSHLDKTLQELRIFEELEERVEHSSFSSTNSSILKMLSSTPSKLKKPSQKKLMHVEEISSSHSDDGQMNDGDGYYRGSLVNMIQEINEKEDVLHHFLNNLKYMVNLEGDELEQRRPVGK